MFNSTKKKVAAGVAVAALAVAPAFAEGELLYDIGLDWQTMAQEGAGKMALLIASLGGISIAMRIAWIAIARTKQALSTR